MPNIKARFLSSYGLRPLQIEDHKAHAPHEAAVLIPLIEHENGLEVLFTVRSLSLRHHAGQISFPGGRKDRQDKSLKQTALRECEEEIGVKPDRILGHLPRYVSNSGFAITPFLGFFSREPRLKLNAAEVSETFRVPLAYLLETNHYFCYPIQRGQRLLDVYWIPWQEHHIWGVTAGILHMLNSHLQGFPNNAERILRK